MIPILYNNDELQFISNGIGRLSDCTRCIVTEERNGVYECEFDYPIEGIHFEEIELGKYVGCTHDDTRDIQPFVIYQRSVPDLNGIVTFYAHHISYKLSDIVVLPYSTTSVSDALNKIRTQSVNENPFNFWTDKTTVAEFKSLVPRNARNMLGGEENSILDVFGGGDYEFDRFTVKLYAHRGSDSGVEIRYSKNMTELSETIDDSESYNAIVPYWADADGNIVMLPEKVIVYEGAAQQTAYLTEENLIVLREENGEPLEVPAAVIDAVPFDMSDAFEEAPTVAQLRTAAKARFEASSAWLPNKNLTVDFVQMWQTEEFKEFAPLQRVRLCDTVSVFYPAVDIVEVKQKVIKTVYNVLLDRYDSIELGTPQTSLGQAIRETIMQEVPTTSMMDAAIQYATQLIRGGLGGYVVMTPGPNGYPQEILIMDTPDINTAVNVWRFNQGGLGHSSSGYEGPFDDIALTQDGRINASMITTGILNADLIQTGTLSADRINGGTLALGGNNDSDGVARFYTSGGAEYGSITSKGVDTFGDLKIIGGSDSGYDITTRMSGGNFSFIRNDVERSRLTAIYFGELLDAGMAIGTKSILTLNPLNDDGSFQRSDYMYRPDNYGLTGSYVHTFYGSLTVSGTKSRVVDTDHYDTRALYCLEATAPLFCDIGEAVLGDDGLCFVEIDDIFSETITANQEYQVFLQKEGDGDCWILEKNQRYFVIKGSPGLKVAWELKAKQKDYGSIRLEEIDRSLTEYANNLATFTAEDYINEQEELLYG